MRAIFKAAEKNEFRSERNFRRGLQIWLSAFQRGLKIWLSAIFEAAGKSGFNLLVVFVDWRRHKTVEKKSGCFRRCVRCASNRISDLIMCRFEAANGRTSTDVLFVVVQPIGRINGGEDCGDDVTLLVVVSVENLVNL